MELRWRVELLGGLRALADGRVVTRFRTQNTGTLLAYLAYHRDRAHPREQLMELLWPEGDPEAGRTSFRQALSLLRRALEPAGVPDGTVLIADRSSVRLNPDAVTTDVAEFDAAIEAAAQTESSEERVKRLARAVELYRGEFLAGWYDDWILREREWLIGRYFAALHSLITSLESAGEVRCALEYAQQGVSVDPLREEAQQDLIRLLAAVGQAETALRQYEALERTLQQELGAAPNAATRAVADEIRHSGIQAFGRSGVRETTDDRPLTTDTGLTVTTPPPHHLNARTPERLNALSSGLEPVGGAVPLESAFYVVRPADAEFREAVERGDSIVLVKGAREMGKTSLLARGLHQARAAGARVIRTDLQMLDDADLASAERFVRTLAEWIADQLGLEGAPGEVWKAHLSTSVNLTRYLRREVLERIDVPVVWGLDGVDRLFGCDFGSQVFALFRAWHNERVLDPGGPWSRLTLVMAYATEAHLFITDVNQSPFNVGTQVTLDDFTLEQVAALNRRYGSPLRSDEEVRRLFEWLGGHPALVRRGLHAMVTRDLGLEGLEVCAEQEDAIFRSHLRRIFTSLVRDPELCEAMRALLKDGRCPGDEGFYRLRSAGILAGLVAREARPRCQLYASYLARHLLCGRGEGRPE